MSITSLIVKREYTTRVRKKSFLIMSILGPVLFAAFMIIPAYLATIQDKDVKQVAVIDESFILTSFEEGTSECVIPDTEFLKFKLVEDTELDVLKENFSSTGYYAVLYIPKNILASNKIIVYSDKQPSLDITSHIRSSIEAEIENQKLAANEIENLEEILAKIETSIKVSSIKWTKDGEDKKSNTGLTMGIGYASGFLIYFFVFMFGAQVMRGVLEEKNSRIVEVIISSVKPIQLMMGKIIGIGLVGLTQFLIWVLLTATLVLGAQKLIMPDLVQQSPMEQVTSNELFTEHLPTEGLQGQLPDESAEVDEGAEFVMDILDGLESINPIKIFLAFIFYFLFGYLLYGSMFAVVGAASDTETDTHQFMLPITLPLILGIFVMITTMNNPDGGLAFWFSMIPFTSPIVMMVRMPFGVPMWELLLSGSLLVITFLGMAWVAGKIYRTGILMYGKKVNYKELWKWLKYKN